MLKNSLKQIKLVKRVQFIQELCKNKKVLHLGATDAPCTLDAIQNGRFLHFDLQDVCRELVGIDISQSMIDFLAKEYQVSNIRYGNIENLEDYPQEQFDVILAGEILEHLSNPGNAIKCIATIAQPDTKIIITVPNAYSLKGFLRAWSGHELIHPDHILHHSPYTLQSLLERYGIYVKESFSFINGGQGLLASLTNQLLSLTPRLAEGIGVICSTQR